MTRIVVTISIHRPIGVVFDYITTPANWPAWHPASRAVSGSVDHSLLIGEQVTEEFLAGGRHGSCVWQVTRREVPYLWTITTSTPRVQAEITYRLSAQGETIIFERELTYVTSGLWFWVFDFLLMRRRMNRESRIALERLKERLERPASRDTAPS
jgi:Polyketide cyclase / dehydrase and lipid transport